MPRSRNSGVHTRTNGLLKRACVQLDELPMMVHGVFSSNLAEQQEATQRFRKLLSIGEAEAEAEAHWQETCMQAWVLLAERNPPIEEVIKTGVVPKFVEFLQRSDAPQLQVRWGGAGVGV